jgi:hypothetical protein
VGALSAAGLTLADWLKLKAHGQAQQRKAKSVIQFFMLGGPTHLDTWDPKPEAGDDYCGPLKNSVQTNVPGIRSSELLPLSAKQADKFSSQNFRVQGFGQSCLLARRLVEQAVPFITINWGWWDTHTDNFGAVKANLPVFDQGFASLMEDLAQRGLLESTIVLWYGEFGRTPKIAWAPALRLVGPVAGALPTNALPLAVGDEPEARETEPNKALPQATRVNVPAAINGRIQQPGDVDHCVITAQANQVLTLDVRARRLDSPLDSFLTVLNARGGGLTENDDFVDPDYPLVLHHSDSRLTYNFPAAGDYILRVRDTQGKGGDEYAYRLVVAPPKPDCVLRMIPDMQLVAGP